MKKGIINKFTLLLISFFILPSFVKAAGSVSASISGGGTVKPGDTVTIYINVGISSNPDDGAVYAFQGTLNYDSEYLEYQSINGASGWTPSFNSGSRKFILGNYGLNAGVKNGSVGSIKFKALKDGSTTVSVTGAAASDTAGDLTVSMGGGRNVNIYTPSSNNNLASLSINPGSISFNGGTAYSSSVGADVTSVTVSAAAQDSKAKISGTGPHNLNYGANNINVVVTAEDGSKKTYTINVNRKDDRSTNNNLASLNVSNGKLSPGFSKGNTKYSMEVPFATSKLNLSAKAEDPKATVSISNPDLVAEETTTVTIKVTAENGQVKTYTISVKRGKDPNKPLSNNNYLANLSVSVGMLSPTFNKEKSNYAVYLPYEVSYIEVYTEVEDTKYGVLKKEENNNLSIGNNLFRYTVTAEDGSERVYTLTVVRNESLDNVKVTNNTYLKKLTLKNGKLIGKFDKKKNTYYFSKKNNKVDIKEAIPEEKENNVSTFKQGKNIIIIVETPAGEKGFYILTEKDNLMLYIILILAIFSVSCLIFAIKKKTNKEDKKVKKEAKKEKKQRKKDKKKE